MRLATLVACLLTLFAAQPDTALATETRTASSVATELRMGRRVVLSDAVVTGSLDLDNIDSVRHLFECHRCVFEKRLSAHDVVFERTLDLSGSTFKGAVDFTGARFQGPALFRGAQENSRHAKPPCTFENGATFSLAVFDDLVSYGLSRFCGEADFRDARFSDATFSGTWFTKADFDRAAFRGASLFADANFVGSASFEEADFRSQADFARAHFDGGGDFAAAHFGDGASFLVASFSVTRPDVDEAATFQDAVSNGDLDFTFATFEGQIATFSGLVAADSLVFRSAEFDPAEGVDMARLQVRDLDLDVGAVSGISDKEQQIDVLKMIEESGKQRGDLATANDAHYEIRRLRSQDYNPVWRSLDYVFYRGVADYFVRPLRPLIVLAVLAAVVAFIRMRRRKDESENRGASSAKKGNPVPRNPSSPPAPERLSRWRRLAHGVIQRCTSFLSCLLDTLARAGPRWQGRTGGEPVLHERLEVVTYRVLLVCALIGLANSNPTLRDMLDSLL